jgi:ketosteroid isomerase-like protein
VAWSPSERRLAWARRVFEAVVDGDVDRLLIGASDEVSWHNPREAIEPGIRRGRDSFAVAIRALLDQFEFERFEIEAAVEIGEAMALRVRMVGIGRGSGAPIDTPIGTVFRFAGERLVEFAWYPAPDDALAAVGGERWLDDS